MPTTTKFIWDDQNYLAEADGSNTINVVYTNEPQQYGNLVSTRISTTTSYHHFDAIGSTRQLTSAAGHVTDSTTYDAWGNVISRSGATGSTLLWIGVKGYYYDQESGVCYVRRRSVNPKIAIWMTRDPLQFADALQRPYAYVLNRPISRRDPSGLDDESVNNWDRFSVVSKPPGFQDHSIRQSSFPHPLCSNCAIFQWEWDFDQLIAWKGAPPQSFPTAMPQGQTNIPEIANVWLQRVEVDYSCDLCVVGITNTSPVHGNFHWWEFASIQILPNSPNPSVVATDQHIGHIEQYWTESRVGFKHCTETRTMTVYYGDVYNVAAPPNCTVLGEDDTEPGTIVNRRCVRSGSFGQHGDPMLEWGFTIECAFHGNTPRCSVASTINIG